MKARYKIIIGILILLALAIFFQRPWHKKSEYECGLVAKDGEVYLGEWRCEEIHWTEEQIREMCESEPCYILTKECGCKVPEDAVPCGDAHSTFLCSWIRFWS